MSAAEHLHISAPRPDSTAKFCQDGKILPTEQLVANQGGALHDGRR